MKNTPPVSRVVVTSPSKRGSTFPLAADFLRPPRVRVVVDSVVGSCTTYTVLFRRLKDRLGFSVQKVVAAVQVLAVEQSSRSLAALAGIQTGDVLCGINFEHFCVGISIEEVAELLGRAEEPIIAHFIHRAHEKDEKSSCADSDRPSCAESPHHCVSVMLAQRLISLDRAEGLTNAINKLKFRTLYWDSAWNQTRLRCSALRQTQQDRTDPVRQSHTDWSVPQKSRTRHVAASAIREPLSPGKTNVLRPALATRVLRAELMTDHVCYLVWVCDVRTGVEWTVLRRFREFFGFREAILAIRPSLCALEFPPKRLVVGSSPSKRAEAAVRLIVLQRFLGRLSDVICSTYAHPSTAKIQWALQRFLDTDVRLESLTYVELPPATAIVRMIEVFVWSVLNMSVFEASIAAFVDKYVRIDIDIVWGHSRREDQQIETALSSIRGFMDHLQSLLMSGLLSDSLQIYWKYSKDSQHGDIWANEDEARKLVRQAIRRQVEVAVFIPVSRYVRQCLASRMSAEEGLIQSKLLGLACQPQDYFGIPSSLASPSLWREAVCTFYEIQRRTLPLDRMDALVQAATEIPRIFQLEHPDIDNPLGADDFLPIFIFVIVAAKVPDLLALQEEMRLFCDPELRMSETGYFVATLEASICHLRENDGPVETLSDAKAKRADTSSASDEDSET